LSVIRKKAARQQEVQRSVTRLQQTIRECQAKQAEYSTSVGNLDGLRVEAEQFEQEIQTRRDKAERYDKRKVSIDTYLREYEKYTEYQRLQTKMREAEHAVRISERALMCAISFARIITDAESHAMQSFLTMLNEECEKHMQIMFDGELSLVVKYNTVGDDESASSTKKAYVDIELSRGGESVPFESLSGGESDRCALVMFLAFNKLSRARMLLLDECLSSLHAESVEDIVEHIKTEFCDRVCVMTLHQTTKGIFDQVIEL